MSCWLSPHCSSLLCFYQDNRVQIKRNPPSFCSVSLLGSHNTEGAPLTSALLKVSFDGRRFTGWSASNDPKPGDPNYAAFSKTERRQGRRRRGSMDPPIRSYDNKGFVRSVQGVLRGHLAKLYGDVDPQQIVVEGCSRTDKGVHARSMMVMIYGLDAEVLRRLQTSATATASDGIGNCTLVADNSLAGTISGMHRPHPRNATDSTSFLSVPKDLSKVAFAMNRMLPPDIRISGIAPIPNVEHGVFHPSLSTVSKTYVYTFSIGTRGNIPDPTSRRWVWHIPASSTQHQPLDLGRMQEACSIIQGTHDFSSFQGAPRGATDRLRREEAAVDSGICTVCSISVRELPRENLVPNVSPPISTQYEVKIVGDRFLYKMVRFLVGAIVDIGLNTNDSYDLHALAKLLQQPDQESPFSTCAPAHGLVLHSVDYGLNIDWQPLRN